MANIAVLPLHRPGLKGLNRLGLGDLGLGLGLGDTASILAENQAWANNPYLQSPAYLAAEAADVGTSVSNPIISNPSVITEADLTQYCQLNFQDNITFGTALDTVGCNGPTPLANLLQQAATITPITGGQPYTAGSGPAPITVGTGTRFGRNTVAPQPVIGTGPSQTQGSQGSQPTTSNQTTQQTTASGGNATPPPFVAPSTSWTEIISNWFSSLSTTEILVGVAGLAVVGFMVMGSGKRH